MLVRLRRKISYANVVATLALFIALGGTSYAAVMITGAQIKDGTITAKDVKKQSLLASNFKNGQLPKGAKGDAGVAGAAGAQGATGLQGLAGIQGLPGAAGSPDTAAQVLAKIEGVDGTGSGLDADKFGGVDAATFSAKFASAYASTRIVHGGGTDAVNGTELMAAITAASTAATTLHPVTVAIEPGIYDVGATAVTIGDFVNLVGAGQDQTFVNGTGTTVFQGGTFAGLERMSISNSGPDGHDTVYVPASGYFRIQDAVIDGFGTGGSSNVNAVHATGHLTITDSEISAENAGGTTESPTGVAHDGGQPLFINGGTISSSATGAGIINRGVSNTGASTVYITDTIIQAGGASAVNNDALVVELGTGSISMDHGLILGGRLYQSGTGNINIGGSQIRAGLTNTFVATHLKCVATYKSDYSTTAGADCS